MREHITGHGYRYGAEDNQRFEYLMVTADPRESVKDIRSRLSEHSEYGRWELARSVVLYGGRRRFLLRRRVMKVEKTVYIA